jgi:hypothetical protein
MRRSATGPAAVRRSGTAVPSGSPYARWNYNNNGGFGRMVFAIVDADVGSAVDDKLRAGMKYSFANCGCIGTIGVLMG